MPMAGKGMLLTSMDIDAADEAEFNRWYDREHLEERVAIPGFLEARRYVAHQGQSEISLPLFDRDIRGARQPGLSRRLANPTEWSKVKTMARFKNMIRAVARITISRGTGRGAVLGIIRLRPDASSEGRVARRADTTSSSPAIATASSRCICWRAMPRLSKPIADNPCASDPGAGDWYVLIDGTDVAAIEAAITACTAAAQIDRRFRAAFIA